MYRALYRSYRPEVFEEVLGQPSIVRILRNQVAAEQVSHAYLFCGTRGTGKTTVARILAKAVNCTGEGERPCGVCENCRAIAEGRFIDLKEIDAASATGVDNIRELRETVGFSPAVGRKKVYILDEVHMLSKGASNALLKTLEEPPEDVMFILCTTEPERLPATVLSRCVRMDFRRVSEEELAAHLARICEEKGLQVEDSGLGIIATAADGSVRDALSILEQCISGRSGRISREDVLDALGTVGEEDFLELTKAAMERRTAEGLMAIDRMLQQGRDARQILQGWMGHLRNLLLIKFMEDPGRSLSISVENLERMKRRADRLDSRVLVEAVRLLADAAYEAKISTQPRVLLEMAFVRISTEYGRPLTGAPQEAPAPPMESAAPGVGTMPQAAESASPGEPGEENHLSAPAEQNAMPAAAAEIPAVDLNALWEAFLDRGESSIGARFFFLRNHARPLRLEEGSLYVEGEEHAASYMQENRDALSAMLSELMGTTTILRASVRSEGGGEESLSGQMSMPGMAPAAEKEAAASMAPGMTPDAPPAAEAEAAAKMAPDTAPLAEPEATPDMETDAPPTVEQEAVASMMPDAAPAEGNTNESEEDIRTRASDALGIDLKWKN